MEVLSPLEHSVLQWDKSCDEQSVDNYNPSMAMNGSSQDNDGYINDQTFHTPSFGDEEFDIPPINLPPTSNSDSVSSDIYGTTQPLSHHHHQQEDLQDVANQQHMLPPSPPLSQHSPPTPASCSQAIGQSMMTTVTSSPPMTPYGDSGQQVQQYSGQAPTNNMPPHPQQQQQQQQHDMYMLQMMPPQAVHFQVQPYGIPTSYATGPSQLLHQQHAPHHQVPPHHPGLHPHHQLQHHHMPQHQPQMMGHHSPMLALHLAGGGNRPQQRPASVGSSPPGSNHTSPGLETSEDSDDSGHLTQLMAGIKRPSPEPVDRPPSGGKPIKKPKAQKKKKKRDPNEPQKPVSAYALFFRDTQAAIKGQNPNASFGEVSKIVASMWDGLEVDHKNVYKRKTEAAKKEYLKALAAYRASLVSKAANDQSDNIYGGGNPGPPTPSTSSSPMAANGGGPSPLQKKSPLLTSLMEGTSPITNLHNMTQPQPLLLGQGTMGSMPPPHMLQPHMQHNASPPQMLHQMLSSPSGQMSGHMVGHHQMNSHPGQQNNGLMNNNNITYSPGMIGSPIPMQHCSSSGNGGQGPGMSQGGMMCSPPPPPLQNCLRNPQEQQQSTDWSNRDYCNTDCVVSHCRDVFTTWVTSRPPPPNSYASVK